MNQPRQSKVQHIKSSDYSKLTQFLNEHWSRDHIFCLDKALFNWQHLQANSDVYSMLHSKENETIAAILGYIPQRHFDQNLTEKELFLAIWKKREDIESLTAGTSLFFELNKRIKPTFVGAFGLSQAVLPFYKAMGYTIGLLDHFVLQNPAAKTHRIMGHAPYLPEKPTTTDTAEFTELDSKSIEQVPDSLFSLHTPQKSIVFIKNRYLNHPRYTYQVHAVKSDTNYLLIVISRLIEQNGTKVMRIVDMIGHFEALKQVTEALKTHLITNSIEYCDSLSHGVDIRHYENASFVNRRNYPDWVVPNYFEPFEQRNIDIDYAFKNQTNKPVVIFRGDSDQDRPNIVPDE